MIRELRKKFIWINMLLVTLVLFAVFSIVCVSSYHKLKDESNTALRMAIERREGDKPHAFHIGQKPSPEFPRDPLFVICIEKNGDIKLIRSENINVDVKDLPSIVQGVITSGKTEGILHNYNLRFLKDEIFGETKIAFIELSRQQAAHNNVVISTALSVSLALLAFFFISLFLSKLALKPVERSWQQQKRFLADASHELKTPLTVILANTSILKSKAHDTVENQIDWIRNTEEEAKRMKKLVDDMLFLAKSDDTKMSAVHERISLSDIVTSTVLAFEAVAFEQDIHLDYSGIAADACIIGNSSQIKQLVGILLDNAIKFSEKGKSVTILLKIRQGRADLSICNIGNSIADEEIPLIFERFYRADKSRSKEGYGLGLAIAKSITVGHGGKISVESNKEAGTVFRVILPLHLK